MAVPVKIRRGGAPGIIHIADALHFETRAAFLFGQYLYGDILYAYFFVLHCAAGGV